MNFGVNVSFGDLQNEVISTFQRYYDEQMHGDMELIGDLEPLIQPVRVHTLFLSIFSPFFLEAVQDPSGFVKKYNGTVEKLEVIRKQSDSHYFITVREARTSSIKLLFNMVYKCQLELTKEPAQLHLHSIEELAKLFQLNSFLPKLAKCCENLKANSNIFSQLRQSIAIRDDKAVCLALSVIKNELPSRYLEDVRGAFLELSLETLKVIVGNQNAENSLSNEWLALIIFDWITHSSKKRGKHTETLLTSLRGREISLDVLQKLKASRELFGSGKSSLTEYLLDACELATPPIYVDRAFRQAFEKIMNSGNEVIVKKEYQKNSAQKTKKLILVGGTLGLGINYEFSKVIEFDPTIEMFTSNDDSSLNVLNLPEGIDRAAVVCHANAIYVIGGINVRSEPVSHVFIYQRDRSIWCKGPSMLTARSCHTALVFQSKLYVCAGMDPQKWRLKTMEVLNLAVESSSWTLGMQLPYQVYGQSCVPRPNGFAILGGTGNFGHLKLAREFNVTKQCWTDLPSMNVARSHAQSASLRGNIYVCGGHIGQMFTNTVECFIQGQNCWIQLSPLNYCRGSGILLPYEEANTMYLFGGSQGGVRGNLLTIEKFEMKDNQWKTIFTSLPTARFALGGCLFPQ